MDSQEKKTERLVDAREIIEKRVCRTCGLTLSSRIFICPNDGTVLADSSKLGEGLSVQYEIIEEIGSGASGVIYKAKHLALDRLVAIKMLHANRLSEISIRRFEQEAKLVNLLDHPSIVRVLYSGVTETGQPYTVLDFVDGQTLAKALEWQGNLTLKDALDVFIQICAALEHAHKKGVLHRDVKPSNIMLVREPGEELGKTLLDGAGKDAGAHRVQKAKLLDFGIAKVIDEGAEKLTRTGEIFGSPMYMSPEQAAGRALDQRSDIYALGVVMYESLTGSPPFQGKTAIEVIASHINDLPRPIKSLNESIPENVTAVVDKALAKNPDNRFQTMSQLKDALLNAREGKQSFHENDKEDRLVKAKRKKLERTIAVLVSLLLVILLAVLGVVGWRMWANPTDITELHPLQNEHERAAELAMSSLDSEDKDASEYLSRHLNDKQIDLTGGLAGGVTDKALFQFDKTNATEKIILRMAKLEGPGLAHLIHLPLKTLILSSATISNRAMVEIRHMKLLQELDLSRTSVTDEGIKGLSDLKHLRHLYLKQEGYMTNQGLGNLAGLDKLEELNLSRDIFLNSSGIAHLSKLPALKILRLDNSSINDDSIKEIKNLKSLEVLALRKTAVSDQGIAQLVHTRIKLLDISKTKTTDKSLHSLAALKSLKELAVHGNKVTPAGLEELQKKRPDIRIYVTEDAPFNDDLDNR